MCSHDGPTPSGHLNRIFRTVVRGFFKFTLKKSSGVGGYRMLNIVINHTKYLGENEELGLSHPAVENVKG